MTPKVFQKKVWDFYKKHGRHNLPWRKTTAPYKILVSEVMLQQTQVDRVIPKYKAFLKAFPTARKLSLATNAEVLKLWSGLGYNRRALFLKRTAEQVVNEYKGKFPKTVEELEKLPGVGPYTARAIATFAYNEPHVFIETNIRTVFLHEFFSRSKKVSDAKLIPFIEQVVSKNKAREWGWALMDYGAHLKKTVPNPSRKSAHHVRQSPFEGSVRQIRGALLRTLVQEGSLLKTQLLRLYAENDAARAEEALKSLVGEGFITIGKNGDVEIRSK